MFKRVRTVIYTQLSQGLRPRECCRAVALGLTIGVFPIMGFSTAMNTLSAAVLRLNQPIVHAFNWMVGPVKIALIFPFLRLGEWIFGAEPFVLSLTEFSERFFSDVGTTTVEFAWTFVHAITGWILCAPLIYGALFALAQCWLRRISAD